MSMLPPADIFEHVDTRPVNERFSNYINKTTKDIRAKTNDVEIARRIQNNLAYVMGKSDEEIHARNRMEYNPGFEDVVWKKLTLCEKMLDNYSSFRSIEVKASFRSLRGEIIDRKMDEFTYGYLEESTVEQIVNDHMPPILEDYTENHRFAKLVTEGLLMAEKVYRGLKK